MVIGKSLILGSRSDVLREQKKGTVLKSKFNFKNFSFSLKIYTFVVATCAEQVRSKGRLHTILYTEAYLVWYKRNNISISNILKYNIINRAD